MPKLSLVAFAFAALVFPLAACSSSDEDPTDDAEHEDDPGSTQEALTGSAVSCTHDSQPAYSGGSLIGNVDTYEIGGKRVTQKTGNAFLYLQKKAAARGVNIWINSGFRTMAEQKHLYYCYTSGSCNNGNLAARPGYSNHQNGRAVDIGTDDRAGLNRVISSLGLQWRRTVPSEAWHYEYFGSMVPGPCDGNATTPSGTDDGSDTTDSDAGAANNNGGNTGGNTGGGACTKDGDCNPGNDGAGLICSNGACVPGCHSNAQCPGVKTCHSGQCK